MYFSSNKIKKIFLDFIGYYEGSEPEGASASLDHSTPPDHAKRKEMHGDCKTIE
tara:strand:+ start:1112 stop:1273 length:162 start_codon:yes stop_codon:yes gene_type:complete